MAIPEPQLGLVISYSYLWHHEHRASQEEGLKNRPCVIVLALQTVDETTMVRVVPVTHSPPGEAIPAIELPAAVKRHLGGARSMPSADGAWLNPENDALVTEQVVLVYTFIDPDRFEQQLPALRRFLHRLGRATNQREVVCEVEGQLFKIRDYDVERDHGSE